MRKTFSKITNVLLGRGNARAILAWKLLGGDNRIRKIKFPENGVIYDVGGYCGVFTQISLERTKSEIFVFEPDPRSFETLVEKFGNNKRVHLHQAGLGGSNMKAKLALCGRASSICTDSNTETVDIELLDAGEFIIKNMHQIGLMKINIEGAEYDVLESMINNQVLGSIHTLVVQFHQTLDEYNNRYFRISECLQKTHRLRWRFPFVWEMWEKIPSNH